MEQLQILKAEAIEAMTRSEIDVAISTAKKYPRDVLNALKTIEDYATIDKETAEGCFYALPRNEKTEDGKFVKKIISGPSARFAEIVVAAWGNLTAGTRVVGNDGKTVTAQAIVHDLEKNIRVVVEVQRRITGKDGRTFTDDMQILTANAAASIAFRNAVFKVVPKALLNKIEEKVKEVSIGKALDIETAKNNALTWYKKNGVTEKELLMALGINSLDEIGRDELLTLKGLRNALEQGETSIEETFRPVSATPPAQPDPVNEAIKSSVTREAKKEEAKEKGKAANGKTETELFGPGK